MLAVLAALAVTSDEARAVIGRPLTPVSYAGVARRTTRRAAYAGAYSAAAYAPPPGAVAALPAGCTVVASGGARVYNCHGTTYRPYYDGPNVVYVP